MPSGTREHVVRQFSLRDSRSALGLSCGPLRGPIEGSELGDGLAVEERGHRAAQQASLVRSLGRSRRSGRAGSPPPASRRLMTTGSFAIRPAPQRQRVAESGHLYSAQTGHFHVAATTNCPIETVLFTSTSSAARAPVTPAQAIFDPAVPHQWRDQRRRADPRAFQRQLVPAGATFSSSTPSLSNSPSRTNDPAVNL